jgi:hypothetical protein
MKDKSIKRRTFLKKGLLISALGTIPIQEIYANSESPIGFNRNTHGKTKKKIERIMLAYGPEFGDIKSVIMGRD